jgi:endonuclease/exonuclease/phosphatase family metal-dependent hydrolase
MCLAPLRILAAPEGHFAEARTIVASDGHYGHALFSRAPMSDIFVHDLSVRSREPRSAIEVTIATASGLLHVVAVHLGLDIAERNRQARNLSRLALEPKGVDTIMLGDFNDWFSFGRVRKMLAAVLPERTSVATFPAARPMLKLDRVYSSAPGSIVNAWVDPEGRRCSDHLPFIAELRLGSHLIGLRAGHERGDGTLRPERD